MLTSSAKMELIMTAIIESKEFWQEQLTKLKESGLSRSQYCRENEINYDRFGYWIKRLAHSSSEPSSFVPVKLSASSEPATQTTLCTIELKNHYLKIHELSALSFILDRLI